MTANLVWGRMQDFDHDPDIYGSHFATIHVANWDATHAYRVASLFWTPWAIGGLDKGGLRRPLSMARQESGSCPSGSTPSCVTYQRFHLGFTWLNSSGIADSAFCPDVFPLPAGDGAVSASDAQWVYSFFVNHAYDVRADIDGNGAITASDAQVVFGNQRQCRP
jgi:hypothetical protein